MTKETLDSLLAEWGNLNALTETQSDTIRRTILATVPVSTEALPPIWWDHFADNMAMTFRQSTPFLPLSYARTASDRIDLWQVR